MKKVIKRLTVFFLVILMSFTPITNTTTNIVIAHSGRTDSRGGHKDNKNKSGLGSYHYHCGGYPAHLHPDGKCPYNSSSTKSNQKETLNSTTSNKTKLNEKEEENNKKKTEKEMIKEVQKALNDLGYDCGKVDGILGKKTKAALKKFQKDYGLKVDGKIGKEVKKALNIE